MPRVACLCPTFDRYPTHGHLLEEAIQSFVEQDYPVEKRHLVVLNDTPGRAVKLSREFMCKHRDNVVVINTVVRYPSLGKKRNALVEFADKAVWPDILMPWDDDDISLPFRISQAVSVLRDYVRADTPAYWNPRWYWYLPGNILEIPGYLGWAHNASAMTLSAFKAVGGYADVSLGEDADMDTRLRKNEAVTTVDGLQPLDQFPASWPYIYRWNVSKRHLSSRGDNDTLYAELGKGVAGPTDRPFEIHPRWGRDYRAFVANRIHHMPKRTYT